MFNYDSDAEQSEALQNFWQRYKVKILGFIFLLLFSIFIMEKIKEDNKSQSTKSSQMFDLLIKEKSPEVAIQLSKKFPDTPYADFAKLWQAKNLCKKQDWQGALKIYDNVIRHTNISSIKALTKFYKAHVFLELKQYDLAISTIDEIQGNYDLVNEFKGDVFLNQGLKDKAYLTYAAAIDATKSPDIKKRIQIKKQVIFDQP